jgi:hypothetical protein
VVNFFMQLMNFHFSMQINPVIVFGNEAADTGGYRRPSPGAATAASTCCGQIYAGSLGSRGLLGRVGAVVFQFSWVW